jgi:hypothetical protein
MRKASIWGRRDEEWGSVSLWKRRLVCKRESMEGMSHCSMTARHSSSGRPGRDARGGATRLLLSDGHILRMV